MSAAPPAFRPGDLIHDVDMGLGIVEGVEHGDGDRSGVIYRVEGIPGESSERRFLAREDLIRLVTRAMFEARREPAAAYGTGAAVAEIGRDAASGRPAGRLARRLLVGDS